MIPVVTFMIPVVTFIVPALIDIVRVPSRITYYGCDTEPWRAGEACTE